MGVATVSAGAIAASTLTNMTLGSELDLNGTSSATRLDQTLFTGEGLESNNSLFDGLAGAGLAAGTSSINVRAMGSAIDAVTEAMVSALRLSDAATVAVGYAAILFAVGFYLGLIALIRYSRGEPITVGRIHGVTSMAEAAPSVAREVMAGVKYMATMVKVAFLLVIELGVFPLLCGWWLDVCTLGMVDVSIDQRVAFFWASPLTSSLLHWLVGIVYMLQISIFVSLLREVLLGPLCSPLCWLE